MARFTDRSITQIKEKLSIVDVMRDYATIEDKGGSKWVKCPFHGGGVEKTASCKLNEDRGTYHCFGCNASGDIFTLVQQKEGLDFPSAVEHLARKAGVELEEAIGFQQKDNTKQSLYDLYSKISNTFSYLLKNNKEAEEARNYLKNRNVSDQMIDTFQLGYAPRDPKWLFKFLKGKGYSEDFLKKSGLFSQNYEGYSLFSNRLMFPIRDRQGRVLAFSGRDLSGNSKAKYINSPETPIYQKKENFFGIYEAKSTIASGTMQPILCEGNFDVVAMHQAGFTSAVASLGTAFTPEQCTNMKKWFSKVKEFHLLFDSDEAGQRETEKAILLVNSKGLGVYVHKFQSAKDASELLEKHGREGVEREFAIKESGFDYLVKANRGRFDINSARGKSEFVRSLSQFLLTTESQVERDSYILSISSMLGLSEEAIREDIRRGASPSPEPIRESAPATTNYRSGKLTLDLFAMLYLCCHRNAFRTYRSKLKFGDLTDPEAQSIYMALENAMRDNISTDELFLSLIDDDRIRNDVSAALALDDYNDAPISVLDEAIDRISLRAMEKRRDVITNQLKLYSNSLSSEDIADLLMRKSEIDKEIIIIKKNLSNKNQ